MRIRKIAIEETPLPDFSFEMEPNNFNLIHGPENGIGKTLILDFLISRFFGKKMRGKEGDFEGTVLYVKNGTPSEALGEENIFQEHYGLEWDTIKNIFCCREGDLKIERKEDLWDKVQEELTRFKGVKDINKEVRKRTYFPKQKKQWKKPKKKEKKELEDSIKKIERVLKSDAYERIRKFEENKKKSKRIGKVIAKKTHEEGNRLLDELKVKKKEIKEECGPIGDVDNTIGKLTDLKKRYERAKEKVKESEEDLKEKKGEVEEKEKKEQSLKNQLDEFSGFNYKNLDKEVDELRKIEKKAQRETLLDRNKWIGPISLVMGLAGILVGISVNPLAYFFGGLLAIPSYGLYEDKQKRDREEETDERLGNLEIKLSSYVDGKLSLDSAKTAQIELDGIEDEIDNIESSLKTVQGSLKTLRGDRGKIDDRRESRKSAKKEDLENLEEFLKEKNCKSVEELEEKLSKKKSIEEDELEPIRDRLIGLLGTGDEESWKSEMEGIEDEFDGDEQDKYPNLFEKNLDELRNERKKIQKQIEDTEKDVNRSRKKIARLGVGNLAELPDEKIEAEKKLESLKVKHRAGEVAIDILERMLSSQENLFLSLFDDVSDLFSEYTEGEFKQVFIEEETVRGGSTKRKIKTEKEDGSILYFSDMSSGEKALLLLLIRTILAKKTGMEEAFFLLDDPILHLDKVRMREKAIEWLWELSEDGWQIFFFTHDDHFLELIEEKIPPEKIVVKKLEE